LRKFDHLYPLRAVLVSLSTLFRIREHPREGRICDLDDVIQRYIFYFGVWEPMISHVTEQMLHKGDVYVDVGANIGYCSLLASNCVGGSGRVVSIEASPTI
jgi:hypothetical protein